MSARGIQPIEEKVKAAQEAPIPQDVSQLKSSLDLWIITGNFYLIYPMFLLLHTGYCKRRMMNSSKLFRMWRSSSHQSVCWFTLIQTRSSPWHETPHPMEGEHFFFMWWWWKRAINCICILIISNSGRKYSQLGLAIVFGVKKFNQYSFGRLLTISSDHKPFQHIFKETSATPTMASARPGYSVRKEHTNADMPSWLPLPQAPEHPSKTIHLMDTLNSSPVIAGHIAQCA